MSTTTTQFFSDQSIDPGANPDDWQDIIASRALREAVESGQLPVVPETLRTAFAARTQVEELVTELRKESSADGVQEFVDKAARDILAGKPLPTDLATTLYDQQVTSQRRHAGNVAAEKLLAVIGQRIPEIVTNALPEILDGIRTVIDDALSKARTAVVVLDGLDIADGEAVADATAKQRAAVADLREASKTYNRARKMQRDALVASHLRPSGTNSYTGPGHTWKKVFDHGIHELSSGIAGELPADMPWHQRIAALSARTDVVVPTPEQMHELWESKVQSWGPLTRPQVDLAGNITNAPDDMGEDI